MATQLDRGKHIMLKKPDLTTGGTPASGASVIVLDEDSKGMYDGLNNPGADPDPDVDPDAEDSEGQIKDNEIKGLSDDLQGEINTRIGKITAARRQAEERADTAESELTEVKTRLDDKSSKDAFALGLDPSYVNEDEIAVLKRDRELGGSETWLLANFDGYVGNGTDADPSMDVKEVREKYSQVSQERRTLSARATTLFSERHKQMMEDMKAGRAARIKLEKIRKPTGAKKVAKKPATIPPGVSATRKPAITGKRPAPGFDTDAVIKKGATPEAIESAYLDVF